MASRDPEPLSLDELSSIEVTFQRVPCRSVDYLDILIVGFAGTYRIGSAGNPDAQYMAAMAEAGVVAWEPSAAILDLSKLHYEWGDMLEQVFDVGSARYGDSSFPVAVIVGPKCEEAIRTLLFGLESSESLDDRQGFCRDLESAWRYVDEQLERSVAKAGR